MNKNVMATVINKTNNIMMNSYLRLFILQLESRTATNKFPSVRIGCQELHLFWLYFVLKLVVTEDLHAVCNQEFSSTKQCTIYLVLRQPTR
jgi:hypothetical protein